MRKLILFTIVIISFHLSHAQKIDSIYFNLYTDSLKKGFFNYINVDGKTTDGKWIPLTTSDIKFSAETGFFEGNDLFVDSSFAGDRIKIKVELKSNPAITREVIIYIRKRGFDEMLKTDEEMMKELMKSKERSI
ncbi:MAG TPA: hypothetical protein VM368_01025 [Flavisolibacter sp.]|nr:hypothetical protein [Flavisolibacter sp.]